MTEEVTSPTEDKAEAPVSNGVPEGYIPREELNEAIKRRDKALKRAQAAESRLAEIEEEQISARKSKAESEGNVDEQKKLYQLELNKKESEIKSLQDELKSHILENKIKTKLSKRTEYLDDSWNLLSDQFGIDKDDEGRYKPVVKANPYRSIDEHIDDFFGARPYLAKNPRKPGGGVPTSAEGVKLDSGDRITFDDLDNMKHEDRIALLAKNPKLKKAYIMDHQVKKRG